MEMLDRDVPPSFSTNILISIISQINRGERHM